MNKTFLVNSVIANVKNDFYGDLLVEFQLVL